MGLIDVQGLSFRYALSKTDSLKGVDLEVGEGEFCLIFGASGCGKTTLLRHLKRELVPAGETSGRVLYRGAELKELDPARSACEIGLVMQNPDSQIVTDVVWHELGFGLENLGVESDAIRRRVAEMASFFGIGSWFHRRTSELSGGQKQLLNLASVLAMQPRLLLLDEPTSQLDPIAAREFIEMVGRLNRELSITVIMTEHRLEEVLPEASRAVLMEDGRIKYNLPPRRLPGALAAEGGRYLGSLPSAARIFARLDADGKSGERGEEADFPLTVREGKERLMTRFVSGGENLPPSAVAPVKNKGAKSGENEKKTALECRDVFFKYEKNAPDVLAGLSLSVREGELFCIMGENGSGKSTLLQILAGLALPVRGAAKLFGRDLRFYPPRELYTGNVGFLPQNPKAVFLHDTLRGDLGEDGEELCRSFGLGGLLDRHPYDLSGGEQQKAALCRVLLQKPRVLLLDEPTKGLDAAAKEELAGLLRRLCEGGAALVLSTHDIEFAARYADRCALLFDGKVASVGDAKSFFSGNCFYTTAANRMARDVDPGAVTCEDVVRLCQR